MDRPPYHHAADLSLIRFVPMEDDMDWLASLGLFFGGLGLFFVGAGVLWWVSLQQDKAKKDRG